jgi:hypothetical protein
MAGPQGRPRVASHLISCKDQVRGGLLDLRERKGDVAMKCSKSRAALVIGFLLAVGCGGQTEGAASLTSLDSSTGGVASSSSSALGGGSSVGGSTGAACSGDGAWSICVTNTGGSPAAGAVASAGDDSCLSPATRVYVKGGNYAGYAFSFISLSPAYGDNLDCSVSGIDRLCMSGTKGASLGGVGVSAIGLNVNQSSAPDSPADPLPRKVTSVTVAYGAALEIGGQLRVQVNQGSNYYCYQVERNPFDANDTFTGAVTIPTDQFTSECWCSGCSGNVWNGIGATGFQLIAINVYSVPMNYDVCLNSLTIN